ncbi:MAG: hypothetical protein EBV03_10415 [Proteobacteria bacterium]|nr:hypothetical protein [Pseudomonadota bacterium]
MAAQPFIADPGYPRPKFQNPGKSWRVGPFAMALGNLTRAETTVAGARANAEIRGVNRFGKAHLDALYGASPELATARDAMMERLGSAGPTRLQSQLEDQALGDLRLGGTLTPEDERMAQQSARGAFASRGMLYSNPAAVAEVLGRQQFADARRGDRRNFAIQVDQLMGDKEQQDQAFTSTAFGQLFDTLDPYKRVYGAYSQAGSQSSNMPNLLNLHTAHLDYRQRDNQMLMEDRLRRDEMNMNAMLAQQQMQANSRAGAIGAGGQVVGALIGF